ncbi:hypothetical protein DOTSEDRAFT_57422 [Dothistroma septosporum NZE10]|uniref:Ubiquitin-like domain-containing protein n=1 Tax=Dothistroma septosporum (strain NZE10 / CBS 128990) TaxID=675120 RepID=N1PBG8_DOTSN|nr:hypothetical protein DOTSEDRAFT_57422 [Dothistroma septosporum NZE10]
MSINLNITLPLQVVSALGRNGEVDTDGIEKDVQKIINYAMKEAVKVLPYSITALESGPSPVFPPDSRGSPSSMPSCFVHSMTSPSSGRETPLSMYSTTPDTSTPMQKPVPNIPLPELPDIDDADFNLGYRDLMDRSHKMRVESTLPVRELMCRLLEELDVWQHGVILLYEGRVLSPKVSVNSSGLKEGDEISLILDTSDELRQEIRTECRDRPASVDLTNSNHDGFTFAVKKPNGFSLVQAYARTSIAEIAMCFQRRDGIQLGSQRWVCDGEPIFDGRGVLGEKARGRGKSLGMLNISHGSVVRLVVAVEQPLLGWKYS